MVAKGEGSGITHEQVFENCTHTVATDVGAVNFKGESSRRYSNLCTAATNDNRESAGVL